jgi:hypothetical protein
MGRFGVHSSRSFVREIELQDVMASLTIDKECRS